MREEMLPAALRLTGYTLGLKCPLRASMTRVYLADRRLEENQYFQIYTSVGGRNRCRCTRRHLTDAECKLFC